MQNLLWIVLVAIVIFGVAISLFSINRKANKYTKVVINRLISEGKYIPGLFVELNNTKEILRYYIYSQKWKKRLIKGYNFIYDNSYGNILKKAYKNTNLQFHLKRRASQREILDAIQNAYDLHKDFEKSSVKSDDDYKESMVLFEVISYPYTEALENLLQYSKASDTKYFVLTGSAGNGKTNLLCSISELLINLKEAVVFLNSRDIHGDIWEFICYQLKLPLKRVRKEQYFYLVNFVLLIRKKYLYIIIDAVNENDNDSFDQQIAEFVNEITKYSRIKIIVSCRNEYYKEHFHEYLVNKVNTPSVEFDLREQQYTEAAVDKMIRAYCKYFNYRGNISLGVKRILSEQLLLLRIFFEVNKNSCADADSIRKHEIYAQYIEIAKKNSEVDIEKILDGIADFMLNSETYDEVSLADLEKMGIAQEILEKALDGSVLLSKKLISHEGTIAKNEKEVVYFVFDEMRDYYLARRILLKNISADNVDGDLILKNLQKLNLMKVSCAEGIIHYCYIFFRTDQVVEKSNQKEKMCSASGFMMMDDEIALIRKYCGAVAVSWYSRLMNGKESNEETIKAVKRLVKKGCITNIHYVVSEETIDEAIIRLENNLFPKGINAVVFILYKPIGNGVMEKVLTRTDSRIKRFLSLATERKHPYRVGFDTCFTPALLRWSNTVPTVSIDACEAATFSMYIDSRMNCYPCSFGIWNKEISESMKDKTLREIWRGKTFSAFREKSKEKCFNCKQKSLCQNGCRLGMNIELC